MTRLSPVIPLLIAKTFLTWNPLVKPVWWTRATLQTTLLLSSAKHFQSSPDSASMQVANPKNGGTIHFAVRVQHLQFWVSIIGSVFSLYFAKFFNWHWKTFVHRQEMSIQHGVLGMQQFMSWQLFHPSGQPDMWQPLSWWLQLPCWYIHTPFALHLLLSVSQRENNCKVFWAVAARLFTQN